MKISIVLLMCLIGVVSIFANGLAQLKSIHAEKISSAFVVDGKLDDAFYKTHVPITAFHQSDPNQGEAPSERTEVWIAFDEQALYIGARMYDQHPDSIMRVLSRRDNFSTSDWFVIFLDPYRDKRSGNYFAIGPSGMMGDGVLYNDDWDDSDWDGVWEGKSKIDGLGWTAEIRIPLSQLKFKDQDEQTWGINLRRDIGRRNERDCLVYTPRNESGFVSRFVELSGLNGIKPTKSAEVFPFVTTKAEYTHPSAGDPFNSGSRYTPEFGADVRYGLSSNVILNATVNPDFGQVEVDPAVVNLSDVESFFQEKRPFFVEGANIFTSFGRGGGRNYWNANFPTPTLFYSRRIGRAPQGSIPSAEYLDEPIATRILGAGKITGKIGDSWNIGTVHAVTNREFANIQNNGTRSEVEVEPMTYYGIARAQKEFAEGKQGLGFLSTYTQRNFSDVRLQDEMNSSALFTGLDGWTFLDKDKVWVVTGWAGFSNVSGNKQQMLHLQQNSTHYFQRPDISHVSIDSTSSSMAGSAGRFYLIRQGNFFVNSAIGFIDPKFEINDLGFLARTDIINTHIGAGYNWSEPDGIFRRKEFGGLLYYGTDYSGNVTAKGFVHFGSVQLMNFYGINWNLGAGPQTLNQRRTRGGPLTLNTSYIEYNLGMYSDDSKDWFVNIFWNGNQSTQDNYNYMEAFVQYRPAPNVTFSIGPSYEKAFSQLQYIGTFSDPTAAATFGNRYVFATIEQHSVGAGIRLNWTFSPTLSLQMYVQPLISSGTFSKFKELKQARSNDYLVYGTHSSTISDTSNVYYFDPDGSGPAAVQQFGNPNFNSKFLRGNAVVRWEYVPGAVAYFVWTQSRSDYENIGDFQLRNSVSRLGNTPPDNIFLIKLSYYFNM